MSKKTRGLIEVPARPPERLEPRNQPSADDVPGPTDAGISPRLSFLALENTGRGLWGRDSRSAARRLRDEWE
ncbi:MAG: hypothetical protein KF915_07705 [Polyangiaceae bacterium]|nr:hypothetical protein [Polyangiaceae bacterium]